MGKQLKNIINCYDIYDGKMSYLLTQNIFFYHKYYAYILCHCTRHSFLKTENINKNSQINNLKNYTTTQKLFMKKISI